MNVPAEVALSIKIGADTPMAVREALTDLLRALRDSPDVAVLEALPTVPETQFFDHVDLCSYFQSQGSNRSQALDQARRILSNLLVVPTARLAMCGQCKQWHGVCRCHGHKSAGRSQPEGWVYDWAYRYCWRYSVPATKALSELDLRNFSKVSLERLRAFLDQLQCEAVTAA